MSNGRHNVSPPPLALLRRSVAASNAAHVSENSSSVDNSAPRPCNSAFHVGMARCMPTAKMLPKNTNHAERQKAGHTILPLKYLRTSDSASTAVSIDTASCGSGLSGNSAASVASSMACILPALQAAGLLSSTKLGIKRDASSFKRTVAGDGAWDGAASGYLPPRLLFAGRSGKTSHAWLPKIDGGTALPAWPPTTEDSGVLPPWLQIDRLSARSVHRCNSSCDNI
mmetsp:Transcript_39513/g.113686  ORF Transcript_39513/g.113686 Transcript_39513/m.113686 type:complete len:226 (-) Transcript_39513:142-819(-)